MNSKNGWEEWCLENEYRELNKDDCFFFRIRGWQVYEIRKNEDLNTFPHLKKTFKFQSILDTQYYNLDFEKIRNQEYPYFALDIQIREVEDCLMGYDCDCILVLDDRDLVENFDARHTASPITLNQLLPVRWYSTVMQNIEVSTLLKLQKTRGMFIWNNRILIMDLRQSWLVLPMGVLLKLVVTH